MPTDDLIADSTDKIEVLKQDNAGLVEKALKQGPEIGMELANGIMLATGKRDGTVNGPWCAIYVSQVKVQAEPKDQQAYQAPAAPPVEVALAPVMQAVGLVEPEMAVTAVAVSPALPVAVDPTTP